jgi:NAD(P)-dependent dehydrogenase (short-subunit alcohol dehydrogenase family)
MADGSRLAGRRVFITGAASGIGKGIAEKFHAEGARLALVDVNREAIEAVAKELDAMPIVLDLSSGEGLEAAIDNAAATLGGLDGLVNCAGVAKPTSIEDTDAALLNKYLAVNLVAPYLLSRAALPHLVKEKGSTIVNIASGQGLLPSGPNNTAYASTKGGLIMFTKSLAIEVGPRGIRVNAVAPGLVRTPMTQFLVEGVEDQSTLPFLQAYALRRMGEPEEIANAVLFLTSAESSLITGSVLAVDAGRCYH